MTGCDRILRNYLRGGWAVEDNVVVILVNLGLFDPAAKQGSLVPLRAYCIALVSGGQFNLNVIQLKAGRHNVHTIIAAVDDSATDLTGVVPVKGNSVTIQSAKTG
jgi:hypothetical protein